MIQEMKEAGMCGIEAVYSENSKEDEIYFRQMADSFGLLVTGGSDFHGTNKPDIKLSVGKGDLKITYDMLSALKDLRNK